MLVMGRLKKENRARLFVDDLSIIEANCVHFVIVGEKLLDIRLTIINFAAKARVGNQSGSAERLEGAEADTQHRHDIVVVDPIFEGSLGDGFFGDDVHRLALRFLLVNDIVDVAHPVTDFATEADWNQVFCFFPTPEGGAVDAEHFGYFVGTWIGFLVCLGQLFLKVSDGVVEKLFVCFDQIAHADADNHARMLFGHFY